MTTAKEREEYRRGYNDGTKGTFDPAPRPEFHVGVDVTSDGAHVVVIRFEGDAGEVIYSKMHPLRASVGVPVDVVREYLDARACYDVALLSSHAPAPLLRHGHPDALRLRSARIALNSALAAAAKGVSNA